MSRPPGVGLPGIRLAAEVRHQQVLLARDPGPMIGYALMGLLLITVTRPLYAALGRLLPGSAAGGIDQAAAGMAVMFSLFALKIGAAHLLNERTWHTWDRLLASPATFAEILALVTTVLGGAIVPVALLPGWLRAIAPASPGYWALDAYRCALTAAPSQLGRPLVVLGVFALAGAGIAAVIKRSTPGG